MEVILAKSAGFCHGVKRAAKITIELAKENKVKTYGPLIHNKIFLEELFAIGVTVCENLKEVNKDDVVVIRSHGVPPSVYKELDVRGIKYVDATCVDVKKIHNIVKNHFTQGYKIIIIGNKEHPEVIGINGYASNSALIIDNVEQINKYFFESINKYCIVVQTTFEMDKFITIIEKIKSFLPAVTVFNTICRSTKERQLETASIASIVDNMIIIGDKQSSNTRKLYEISKNICPNSYLLDTISEIELNIFSDGDKIGISAGASTPPRIIKEAIKIMSEQNNNELSFEEMLDQSIITLHTGDIVKGKVINVSDGEVFVNLGYKSDGIISKEELSDNPSFIAEQQYKPGDEIEVFVLKINDGEGNVQLSRKRIEAKKGLEELAKAYNNKDIVKGKVLEVVKSGYMTLINGIKVFVPSSQISNRFVEDLNSFVGQELDFNIIEFEIPERTSKHDRNKKRIIAGRKELAKKEEEENKAKVFENIEVGVKREGVVRRIVDFGAFVDLGGIDGLIHISELSWGRVKKVTDVLKQGDIVSVTIIDFDKDKSKISLTLKDVQEDPWYNIEERYPIGTVVSGKVARMVPFGVFVELEEGIDGLVHISHISDKHVVKPEDILKIGEIINVRITDVNRENKRISLSKKEADEPSFTEEVVSAEVDLDGNASVNIMEQDTEQE